MNFLNHWIKAMKKRKTKLNESIIRPEEIKVYGSNVPDYDDYNIGYHAVSRSYFIVSKISEEEYLSVAVSRHDGLLRFTVTNNEYIGRMIHLRAMYRMNNLRVALRHLGKVLFMLSIILKRFHTRIPSLKILAFFPLMDRAIGFLSRSPMFRVMLKKLRFRTFNRQIIKDDDSEYVMYEFKKEKEE